MLIRSLLLLLLAVAGFSANSDLGLGPAPVTSAAPSGAAGGDLAGTYPNPTVTAARFSTPGAIGDGTPSTGAFTTLSGATSITDAGLTATRVTFAGTAGILSDDSGLTYASASDLLVVNHNAAAAPAAPTGTQLQVLGVDSTSGVITIDTGAAQASFLGRRANTSIGSPSALVNNDTIVQLAAQGYGTSAYTTSARGIVRVVATETWTDAAMGTRLEFLTTANTTLTTATRLTITGASATFASGVPVTISDTTASTTTAGALLIGNGTAATSVTMGNGVCNVGSSLIVGGQITSNNAGAAASSPAFVSSGTSTIAGGITDGYTTAHRFTPIYNGAFTVTRHNYIDLNQITGTSTITDAAVFRFDAATGTHKALAADGAVVTTFTGVGPTGAQTTIQGWMKINVNGTLRYIPFWEQEVFGAEWRESAVERMNHYPTRFLASQASRPYDRSNVLDME